MVKSGVTLLEILAPISSLGGLMSCLMASDMGNFNHLVESRRPSSVRCATRRATENCFDKKVSSPTKRQLTVHLNRNRRVNSNALEQ